VVGELSHNRDRPLKNKKRCDDYRNLGRHHQMNSISQAFETSKTRSARIYRWVIAWLCVSAVIALLLLANSIRDYRFVSGLIATQQVRHQMSQHAAALERQLRQDPMTREVAWGSSRFQQLTMQTHLKKSADRVNGLSCQRKAVASFLRKPF
jgi:hypothetical protein